MMKFMMKLMAEFTPNGLAAPVVVAKNATQAKPAGTDFRQALAVAGPASADGSTAVSIQNAESGLIQSAATPAAALGGTSEKLPKAADNTLLPGAKRAAKAPWKKTAAAAINVGFQPGAAPPAVMAVAASAVAGAAAAGTEKRAATGAVTGTVSASGAPPAAAAELAMPTETGLHKPEPVAFTGIVKPGTAAAAAPEKASAALTVLPNIPASVMQTSTAHAAPALHAPAKTAEIIRQIAAALPPDSLANAVANPVTHISLNPETLGTITVKITQHASGETAVTLSASQPETLAALKHDAANLNQILTNAGVPEANRQLDFQTMPVSAPQISTGLNNAGGQNAGGQSAGGQFSGGQQPQSGTAFANLAPRPALNTIARARLNHALSGVDVIA